MLYGMPLIWNAVLQLKLNYWNPIILESRQFFEQLLIVSQLTAHQSILEERNTQFERNVKDGIARVSGIERGARQVSGDCIAHLELYLPLSHEKHWHC